MNTLAPSRFGFALWLGVSLLLHGALSLPWLWFAGRAVPTLPHQQLLVLDLAGLVGTRQVEAAAGPRSARPPQPRPAPPRGTQAPAPPAPPRHSPPTPPIAGAAASPTPAPSPVAPEVARPKPEPEPEVAPPGTADEARVAQTIRARSQDEAAAIQQYLRALRQAIQSRLVYPPEARALGAVGAPVIRFAITASGDIQPGSLSIQESSGYPVLDDKALAAALASAPLARPPKPMKVAIAVSFTREP